MLDSRQASWFCSSMDPKKWVFVVLFSFVLLGLSATLFITEDHHHHTHEHEAQLSFLGELKRAILNTVDEASWLWRPENQAQVPLLRNHPTETLKSHHVPLSPNLSTCHRSRPVYCCPPNRESDEPVIDFQFPDLSTTTVRIRRPAHKLDQAYMSKYNKALSIMKSLPSTDPRSFMRQANIHCIYCTGAYNQKHSNSILNIHRSWMFFPFHRMMIYFHERILGRLIDDDTFALPFWNWDNPEGMFIPDMYLNGSFIDAQRDRIHLPPQVADLDFDYIERELGREEQIERNIAFMYHQMISGAKKTELFMGCPYRSGEDGFCNGPGTIELAPHNALHSWVGNSDNPRRENMGAFYSAARDPIFYAHHSNIDRLWEVWREINGHKLDIDDPEWLDSYFYFHNEKSQLVRIRIRDVLDHKKLGYVYEEVDNSVWMNARPKPAIAPKIARQILKLKEQEENENGLNLKALKQDFGPEGITLDKTVRVKVQRPKTQRSREEKLMEEEVLVVYDINVKKDSYVKFDVYVNAVDETSIGPEAREFAGTFVNMRKGVKMVLNKGDVVVKGKTVLKLGISELLEDLEAEGEENIRVTLVPRGGTGVNTTVGGVQIEYLR